MITSPLAITFTVQSAVISVEIDTDTTYTAQIDQFRNTKLGISAGVHPGKKKEVIRKESIGYTIIQRNFVHIQHVEFFLKVSQFFVKRRLKQLQFFKLFFKQIYILGKKKSELVVIITPLSLPTLSKVGGLGGFHRSKSTY
eukprot:TRINITY_DN4538_c0_g1_i12.p2 TRINITY_DN4538_c0_g1~~TRINITY_DN4538_c0_g1_i12.p2  ORF type:complete len:141 (+),score=10.45 TRINITY_DN4538_c0_g1_i12:256-678(+)